MLLRYVLPDGEQKEYRLTEKSITIGRGAEVDVIVPDKMASRVHCGISFWDDAYFVRDFKSRNGTYVNDNRIDVFRLKPGDRVRIGDTIFTIESTRRKGTETVINEVNDEMSRGKGYHTILHEIIGEDNKDQD